MISQLYIFNHRDNNSLQMWIYLLHITDKPNPEHAVLPQTPRQNTYNSTRPCGGPFRSPGCFYLLLYLDWALTHPIKTQIQIVIWGDCAAEELFSKASHPESEGCSPYRHLKVTHSWITCTITRIIKIQKINNWWWDITGMGLSTSTHCGGAFCLLSGTSNRLLPYLSDGEASFECYLVEDVVCWYLKETNSTVYCKAIVGFMSVDASFSS